MDADLRELYQDVILDHGKKPRNFKVLDDANATAEGHNPLCGDRCVVYARIDDGTVQDVSFQGKGCAISQASASLMTQIAKGKTPAEIEHLADLMVRMVKDQASDEDRQELGKLEVLAGVREFPSRVKCATLAWHTLVAALHHENEKVTTE